MLSWILLYMWPDVFVNNAGTFLVEIALQAIGMVVQIVTLKMVMGKTEAMRGIVAHAGPMTGIEVEDQQELREEVTETDWDLMNALIGQGAHLPLTTTKCFVVALFWSFWVVNALLRFGYF